MQVHDWMLLVDFGSNNHADHVFQWCDELWDQEQTFWQRAFVDWGSAGNGQQPNRAMIDLMRIAKEEIQRERASGEWQLKCRQIARKFVDEVQATLDPVQTVALLPPARYIIQDIARIVFSEQVLAITHELMGPFGPTWDFS